MTKPSINLVGAFDRYNYGDLLFPRVIQGWLKKFRPDLFEIYSVRCFGLIAQDLSFEGGPSVRPLHELLSEDLAAGSLVVLAGGDLLPARLSGLSIDLAKNGTEEVLLKILRKVLGSVFFESWMKRRFKVESPFPWIIAESLFKGNAKVVYNSVGGASLVNMKKEEKKLILAGLHDSSYRSFRDKTTAAAVEPLSSVLAPDCAVLVSDLETVLKINDIPKLSNFIGGGRYFVVQCGAPALKKGNISVLADQIDRLAQKTGFKAVCLPLGIARNHNDIEVLSLLSRHLKTKPLFLDRPTVLESMNVIANADFFVGSSLHGCITSISFGVPFVALGAQASKLGAFLQTWMPEPFLSPAEFGGIENMHGSIQLLDRQNLQFTSARLKHEAHANFCKIFQMCDASGALRGL